MDKKIILWIAVIVGVIAGMIAIAIIPRISRGQWITPSQVQRVEFWGFSSCESTEPNRVELSESEIRTLISHFRSATYAGKVDAEGCDCEFSFVIYLTDGTKIAAREATAPRIHVDPPQGEAYWIQSKALASYAQELIKKYGYTS